MWRAGTSPSGGRKPPSSREFQGQLWAPFGPSSPPGGAPPVPGLRQELGPKSTPGAATLDPTRHPAWGGSTAPAATAILEPPGPSGPAPCANCTAGANPAFAALYGLIFALGLGLNGAALALLGRGGRPAAPTATYLRNLAACDLLLVASLPARVAHYAGRAALPRAACELLGWLLLVNMYGSIFLLTGLNGDRWAAVCLPLHAGAARFRRRAALVCAAAWALSALGCVPVYAAGRRAAEEATTAAEATRCFDERPRYITQPAVAWAMAAAFGLPLAVVVGCSWALLRAVGRSPAARMALLDGAKVRRMVLSHVAIFLACFMPFHAVLLCYQLRAAPGPALDQAYRCTLLLACTNAVLDPLAYYFAAESFPRSVATPVTSPRPARAAQATTAAATVLAGSSTPKTPATWGFRCWR
ncbi:lysophosphatidic acid receptor 5-like [Struthio camelus]|uniref:lysophosphatidic acid receptor 5-like n=1 Tax=Struthio camelus TaxID=8801 RepID=UPI003603C3D5